MVARHGFDSSLPVISFNYHIIGFYRRGAGCQTANEGEGWHAELRAFFHRFDGACASARTSEGRGAQVRGVRERVWRVQRRWKCTQAERKEKCKYGVRRWEREREEKKGRSGFTVNLTFWFPFIWIREVSCYFKKQNSVLEIRPAGYLVNEACPRSRHVFNVIQELLLIKQR